MEKSMTSGSPLGHILRFTFPLLIGNIFQQFYNMADTVIVGRTIGIDALAAVGSTGSIVFLILGFSNGTASGLTIPLAQKFGGKDSRGVKKSFATGILITIVVSLLMMIVSVLACWTLLSLLRTPEDIKQQAYDYLVVILAAIPVSMAYNFLASCYRAIGDSRTPLVILIIACFINIALDYLFIVGLGMGVRGAAVATVLAQLVSVILCASHLLQHVPMLRPTMDSFKVTYHFLMVHLRIAIPMGLQLSIIAIGSITLQMALNQLGSTAVAAYTSAVKVDQLASMPLMSVGVTMGTYVAQNYGAKAYGRIWQGVRLAAILSFFYSLFMGLVLNLFGTFFITLLLGQPSQSILTMTRSFFLTNSTIYFFLGWVFVFRHSLQGLGVTVTPMVAGLVELFMRAFAAMYLAKHFGFIGATLANPLAWIGALIPICTHLWIKLRHLHHLELNQSMK